MTATVPAFDWSTESTEPVEAKIRRDRWSRYLIPHPDTGKEQAWTRATTLAGTLADRYGLEQWAKRNVVLGIGARRDLYALAASCTPDDKADLNKIVSQAEEAAKGKAGANAGTAMHRLTERLDAGETIQPADPQLAADLDAYRTAMTAAGIRVARSPQDGRAWIERVLLVPDIGVAGTCDRICLADTWTLPRIGDLKTAKDVVRYGMVEIALQLAIYAHATHWYDPASNQLHPMPTVDRGRALVMHLPVGQATCLLYDVDIAAGWEAVQLAIAVREWRKRKNLATRLTAPVLEPPGVCDTCGERRGHQIDCPHHDATWVTATSPERVAWLRQRVQAIVEAGHGDELAQVWAQRPDIPTLRQGGLTDGQVTVAAGFCAGVEMLHGMPFHSGDPAYEQPTVTATEPAAPPPAPTDVDWAERGRELLAEFADHAVQVAVADCARCTDIRINETDYRRLEAVHHALADGPLRLAVDEHGVWTVEPSPDCTDTLAALYGGRQHALTAAKTHAKTLCLPAPRSLALVAENPLLAAFTATGAPPSSDEKKGS